MEKRSNQKLDVGLGSPLFLKPYWDRSYFKTTIHPMEGIPYSPSGGLPQLKDSIRNLHRHIGNAEVSDREIVIGYGATQLLSVAVQAAYSSRVFIRPPYYFRTPQIVNAAGAEAITDDHEDEVMLCDAEIVTLPSNPLLLTYDPVVSGKVIYDLSYQWPTYLETEKIDQAIMIFGMSKCTGHAGNRIGWAIVADEDLADSMNAIIECTSGGVSRDAQMRARDIINSQVRIMDTNTRDGNSLLLDTVFEYGKNELESRWKRLLEVSSPDLVLLNRSGMFAWCEYKNGIEHFERKYNVKATSGIACGGDGINIRLNVGCSNRDFEELLVRLSDV